jgi:hypothetical protein
MELKGDKMEVTFILPLILLPGVALLIVSTAARYGQLHDEVHRALDHAEAVERADLRQRARYFRDALVALYACVALFALASLSGVLFEVLDRGPRPAVIGLTSIGIMSLLYAAYALIREALLSLDIIERHLKPTDTPK